MSIPRLESMIANTGRAFTFRESALLPPEYGPFFGLKTQKEAVVYLPKNAPLEAYLRPKSDMAVAYMHDFKKTEMVGEVLADDAGYIRYDCWFKPKEAVVRQLIRKSAVPISPEKRRTIFKNYPDTLKRAIYALFHVLHNLAANNIMALQYGVDIPKERYGLNDLSYVLSFARQLNLDIKEMQLKNFPVFTLPWIFQRLALQEDIVLFMEQYLYLENDTRKDILKELGAYAGSLLTDLIKAASLEGLSRDHLLGAYFLKGAYSNGRFTQTQVSAMRYFGLGQTFVMGHKTAEEVDECLVDLTGNILEHAEHCQSPLKAGNYLDALNNYCVVETREVGHLKNVTLDRLIGVILSKRSKEDMLALLQIIQQYSWSSEGQLAKILSTPFATRGDVINSLIQYGKMRRFEDPIFARAVVYLGEKLEEEEKKIDLTPEPATLSSFLIPD